MNTLFEILSNDMISWIDYCGNSEFGSLKRREGKRLWTKKAQELLIGKYILWKSEVSDATDNESIDYCFDTVMHITDIKYDDYCIEMIGDTATVTKDKERNIISINFINKDSITIGSDVEVWSKEFKEIPMEDFYKFVDDAKKQTNFFYPMREFEMAYRNGDFDQKEYLSLLYKNTIKDVL